MRLRRFGWDGRLLPVEPTPTEAFIQREFVDAVAFAADQWQSFNAESRRDDLDWEHTFTLRQRLTAFMAGPIFSELEAHFPRIASLAAEADAETGLSGHEEVILEAIVAEGVIASGTSIREEVRRSIQSEP